MIELDQESCRDLNTSLTSEWLETNGIGGFSSSTICGLNTRRYHGLLTAATTPRGCVAQAWSVAELLRVVADLETTYQTDLNDVLGEQIFSFHS